MSKRKEGGRKSGGSRKHDRNRVSCSVYQARDTRMSNKIKRLVTRIKKNPNDFEAVHAWKRLTNVRKVA